MSTAPTPRTDAAESEARNLEALLPLVKVSQRLERELAEANRMLDETMNLPHLFGQLQEAKTVLRVVVYHRLPLGERVLDTLPFVWQKRAWDLLEPPQP